MCLTFSAFWLRHCFTYHKAHDVHWQLCSLLFSLYRVKLACQISQVLCYTDANNVPMEVDLTFAYRWLADEVEEHCEHCDCLWMLGPFIIVEHVIQPPWAGKGGKGSGSPIENHKLLYVS